MNNATREKLGEWLGIAIFGLIAWYAWTHWRNIEYSFLYSTHIDNVHIDTEPTSCDWGRAPLGDKACHYEKSVSTILSAKATDGEIMTSDDEGKTWYPNLFRDSKTEIKKDVYIRWEKKEDP